VNEWDQKTRLRVRALMEMAGEKYGDNQCIAVGQYPDGRWFVRSLDEGKFGSTPFVEASSLSALEVMVSSAE
jgi:hypothetical protein